MYRPDLVQPANDIGPRSEDVARRLLDLEAYAYGDPEALPSCVSDRLHFCSSPDFDDNAEVAYTLPDLATNNTYPGSLVTIGPVIRDLLAPSMCSFTGTDAPSCDIQDGEF